MIIFGINTKQRAWSNLLPRHLLDVHGDGITSKAYFLSGSGGANSPDEAGYTDVGFFVSGSRGHRGWDKNSVALFGGDTVVSGAIYTHVIKSSDIDDKTSIVISGTMSTHLRGGKIFASASHSLTLLSGKRNETWSSAGPGAILMSGSSDVNVFSGIGKDIVLSASLVGVLGQQGDITAQLGTDAFLFVSGTRGGKVRSAPKSVAVFGGDVQVSGSLVQGSPGNGYPVTFYASTSDNIGLQWIPGGNGSLQLGTRNKFQSVWRLCK